MELREELVHQGEQPGGELGLESLEAGGESRRVIRTEDVGGDFRHMIAAGITWM